MTTKKALFLLICILLLCGAASCSNSSPSLDTSDERERGVDEATNLQMPLLSTQQQSAAPTVLPEDQPSQAEESSPTPVASAVDELSTETIVSDDGAISAGLMRTQAMNLQKLCKVWGFLKYTHMVFLTGEKDWDQELLSLIPIIQFAEEDEVNNILYDWYISLGDDGYDDYGSSVQEQNMRRMADISWTIDESYLGEQLSSALARFREIPDMDRSKAPVFFRENTLPDFSNEKRHTFYYSSVENRLQGLFRLWNAIEYYFPYKDIMDYNWDELLLEYIPEMINGADADSYWLTLCSLSAKTNDGHVGIHSAMSVLFSRFSRSSKDPIAIPAILERAEGQIVVCETIGNSFLQRGDVVISIAGVDINDKVEEIKQYVAVPNAEKLKRVMLYLPLCKEIRPEVTVLRDGEVSTGTVAAIPWRYEKFEDPYYKAITKSHELLEDNIGVINPSRFKVDQVHSVMKSFSVTSGLIIDMRQYQDSATMYLLAEYMLNEVKTVAIWSAPFTPVPGLFRDYNTTRVGPGIRPGEEFYTAWGDKPPEVIDPYFYNKPVVILIDQHSQSACETMIMSLRAGPNVTVIGRNTTGANGVAVYLPHPGGDIMQYSGTGGYTHEGGQMQRIGLTPDIYVERTIEGIRDGRDELKVTIIL